MKKNILIISGIIILLAIIIGTFYFLYSQNKNRENVAIQQKNEFSLNNKKGRELSWAGKFSEAGPYFEKAVSLAGNSSEKGAANLRLAKSYLLSEKSGQLEKGIDTLKNMIADSAYPAFYRARAFSILASHYPYTLDDNFVRQNIFAGKFKKYLDEAGGNINLASKKLSEESIGLYPIADAHYRLGLWYADNELLSIDGKNVSVDQKNREDILQKIKYNLGQGDKLFATLYQEKYIEGAEAFYYDLRTKILARLLIFDVGTRQEVDEAFSKTAEEYKKIPVDYASDFWFRFQQAAFIAEFDGEKGQGQMEAIIEPIIKAYDSSRKAGQDNFFQALGNLGKSENSQTYIFRQVLLVAKYNQTFKDMLVKIGWNNSNFERNLIPIGEVNKNEEIK